jgi:hypothetical protein
VVAGLEALEHLGGLSGSLTSLDCSGNALRCVRGVAALPRLRDADLRHNALATLADATAPLRPLTALRQLSLAGNPLCGAFASADTYRAAVAAALPQLTHLDGAPLPARARVDDDAHEEHAWGEEEEEEEKEEEREGEVELRSARPLRVRWREGEAAAAPAPPQQQQQQAEQQQQQQEEQQALREELAAARRAATDAIARADAAEAAAAAARRAAEAAEAARAQAAVAAARSDAAAQARTDTAALCWHPTRGACFSLLGLKVMCLTRRPAALPPFSAPNRALPPRRRAATMRAPPPRWTLTQLRLRRRVRAPRRRLQPTQWRAAPPRRRQQQQPRAWLPCRRLLSSPPLRPAMPPRRCSAGGERRLFDAWSPQPPRTWPAPLRARRRHTMPRPLTRSTRAQTPRWRIRRQHAAPPRHPTPQRTQRSKPPRRLPPR